MKNPEGAVPICNEVGSHPGGKGQQGGNCANGARLAWPDAYQPDINYLDKVLQNGAHWVQKQNATSNSTKDAKGLSQINPHIPTGLVDAPKDANHDVPHQYKQPLAG